MTAGGADILVCRHMGMADKNVCPTIDGEPHIAFDNKRYLGYSLSPASTHRHGARTQTVRSCESIRPRTEPRRVKLSPRVLIVDASRESREVLRMLLELRGATAIEAVDPAQALQLTHTARPDLILLDADSDLTSTGEPTNDLREAASRNHTPIVILGKLRQLHGELETGQIVTKPYHYGPLIRKIDRLLAAA